MIDNDGWTVRMLKNQAFANHGNVKMAVIRQGEQVRHDSTHARMPVDSQQLRYQHTPQCIASSDGCVLRGSSQTYATVSRTSSSTHKAE